MKLLNRRAQLYHHENPLTLRKYYRWVLWLCLSLYLFLSSSFLPKPATAPLKHRSLVETRVAAAAPPAVRIYVYDLPSAYNADWLAADRRCGSHLFAAEVALHAALLASPARALDPRDADFYFLPVYVSCNFSTPNGFPSLGHARALLAAAAADVAGRFPFWNRSAGGDHVFAATHDYGACFHAMEESAVREGIPDFLRGSILLQTFGVRSPHRCQAAEHVLIPPYVPPEVLSSSPAPEAVERDIFVFFRGKMEVHPKNISGRFYSKKVRTEIWNRFSSDRRFYLKRKRFEGYRSEIARSVFCLCPLGWAPWSPRLVESVALGCVPVIIADGIRLPFPAAVPWPEISLTVPERDVASLAAVLEHVAATNLSAIQRRLWDPAVRTALLFHREPTVGDATWLVLRALEGKIDRSWRRRRWRGHVE